MAQCAPWLSQVAGQRGCKGGVSNVCGELLQDYCCFSGSLHFPRKHDRHAAAEAGPQYRHTRHSRQRKMTCAPATRHQVGRQTDTESTEPVCRQTDRHGVHRVRGRLTDSIHGAMGGQKDTTSMGPWVDKQIQHLLGHGWAERHSAHGASG